MLKRLILRHGMRDTNDNRDRKSSNFFNSLEISPAGEQSYQRRRTISVSPPHGGRAQPGGTTHSQQ
jgi:hypothetical protein